MRNKRWSGFMGLLVLALLSILLPNLGSRSGLSAAYPSLGLACLPAQIDFVVHVDVQRAIQSPLFKRLLGNPEYRRKLELFIQEAGIDPQQDITEILVGGMARGGQVVLLRGPFLREKLYSTLKRRYEVLTEDDYKGYSLIGPSHGAARGKVVFFDADLVGIGEQTILESCIDVRVGASGNALNNSQLTGLLAHINQTDAFWLAGAHIPSLPPNLPLRSLPIPSTKLRNVALSGNLDMGISGRLLGFFDDAETAKNVAAMGEGLLAMARLKGNPKPQALPILNGFRIDSYANQVALSVQIPYAILDKIWNGDRQVLDVR